MPQQNTVERAFQLAQDGTCRTVEHIRRQLKVEGFAGIEAHLSGLSIKKQLVGLMQGKAPPCAVA